MYASRVALYLGLLLASRLFSLTASAAAAPVPANLISWWAGEETPLDIAGGLHASAFGSPQYATGKVARAFSFDGTNDVYVVDSDDRLSITGDLTIEAWVRATNTSGERTIVSKRSADNADVTYVLFLRDGILRFATRSGGGSFADVSGGVAVSSTGFSHVAVTITGSTLRLYVDGVSVLDTSTFPAARPATTGAVTIGASIFDAKPVTTPDGVFAGEIDEVSIYNRGLTTGEIVGIYNAGAEGKLRFDAARDFESYSPSDAVQTGIWRYGTIPLESAGSLPSITSFTVHASGIDDGQLNSWITDAHLNANRTPSLVTRVGAGGPTIYFAPSALTLHPGSGGQYSVVKWTAPAAGDYAVSALFGGADGRPTNSDVQILSQTAFGVRAERSKTPVVGCPYENKGATVTSFHKLPLDAGESVYVLIGWGPDSSNSFDNTSVFLNIVPLRLLANPPSVTTAAATAVNSSGATANGTVNPNGSATTAFFEYGTTTAYGQSTAIQTVGAGSTAVQFTATLSGLTVNTTYHFRLVAANAGGRTTGTDLTFTTGTTVGPFTVRLVGQESGVVVRPETGVEIEAVIEPANAGGATITGVQFYVNDQPNGGPDTEAPYELSTIVSAPGERNIYAVATDSQGRTAISPSIIFSVADGTAGILALQTTVEPASQVAPGSEVTYTLVVTNTSPTAKVKGVKLACPIPDGTSVVSANLIDSNGQPTGKRPKVAKDRESVQFDFENFEPLQVKRARLKVLAYYDLNPASEPIRNRDFTVTGKLGRTNLEGEFGEKLLTIAGSAPVDSPRLALAKAIVDLEESNSDNTEFAQGENGPVALTAIGDQVTFFLVATNYGDKPASRVTLTDRIPEGFQYVDRSARVNGKAAGGVVKVKGNKLVASFGDFEAGQSVVLTYRAAVTSGRSGLAVGATVQTEPAFLESESLDRAVDSAPERLDIQIVDAAKAVLDPPRAFPPESVPGESQRYKFTVRNPNKRPAKNVRFRQVLPANTTFQDAFIDGPKNMPQQPDGSVIFDFETVAPGAVVEGELIVKVDAGVRSQTRPRIVLPAPIVLDPANIPLPNLRAQRESNLAGLVTTGLFTDFNAVFAADLPKVALTKIVDRSVNPSQPLVYNYTVINTSNVVARSLLFRLEIPENAEFVESDKGTYSAAGQLLTYPMGFIDPHTVIPIRVVLKATGPVGHSIVEKNARVVTLTDPYPDTFTEPTATAIIQGDASNPQNQVAIERAQLSLENNDGSVATANLKHLGRVRKITNLSKHYVVSGADFIELNNGGWVVPTGGGSLVAAGGGNLIGNDGSTLVGLDGATLIGNDGSTLTYFGPANRMIFNLIGNDGSTLIGNDGSTLLDAVVRGLPGNLVAAGGGNLVDSSATNLVGNDGASLISNLDGSKFPLANLKATLNSGLGGLLAPGNGAFLPDLETVTAVGDQYLITHGGGNIITQGGGALVTDNGAGLISNDAARARGISLEGSAVLGGGGRIISDNSGGIPRPR